jgi:hypothetical protein
MPSFEIGLITMHGDTPRDQEAREQLAAVLPDDAAVGALDPDGAFTVTLDDDDLDAALTTVWDAVAASGTDDHLLFLEHPDLPEHWRHRSRTPGELPGGLG